MRSIHSLIPPECVLIHPDVRDKNELIKILIAALDSAGRVKNPESLYKAVLSREELAPTGIGSGCAIPHAHSAAMENTVIAAAVLENEIDFQAPDGNPAFLVFLMAGPERHAGLHLQLLSRLVRLLHNTDLIENLQKAPDEEEFISLIKNREE